MKKWPKIETYLSVPVKNKDGIAVGEFRFTREVTAQEMFDRRIMRKMFQDHISSCTNSFRVPIMENI